MTTITYFYRGPIERSRRWCYGYSANGPGGGTLYPWMTKRECYADARAQGCQAVFVRDLTTAKPSPG